MFSLSLIQYFIQFNNVLDDWIFVAFGKKKFLQAIPIKETKHRTICALNRKCESECKQAKTKLLQYSHNRTGMSWVWAGSDCFNFQWKCVHSQKLSVLPPSINSNIHAVHNIKWKKKNRIQHTYTNTYHSLLTSKKNETARKKKKQQQQKNKKANNKANPFIIQWQL